LFEIQSVLTVLINKMNCCGTVYEQGILRQHPSTRQLLVLALVLLVVAAVVNFTKLTVA
jgi:hypothetical protein